MMSQARSIARLSYPVQRNNRAMVKAKDIVRLLTQVAAEYPDDLREGQLRDIPRVAFQISLVLQNSNRRNEDVSLCDIGGGIGLFSIACAALGFNRVLVVDDFRDEINRRIGTAFFDSLHRKYGVELVVRDVITDGLGDFPHGIDVMTTFDSMEHWHHSPKKLFREVVTALRPGGVFILGAPNCVNLRKRMTVPLGFGKWTTMHDWYESEVFRGHVREPDVADLHYIARDMALDGVKIMGRNWLGHFSSNALIRLATKLVDYPLRVRPSLCSDLYMIGFNRSNIRHKGEP
jgi:SAM-dependent methyltransferase